MNQEYHIYEKAKKKVKEKRKFYSHLFTWIIFSVFFILLNLVTSHYFWAIFPILGWGIGVAFHGIKVFSLNYGDDWEEREIMKEVEKLRQRESYFIDRDSDDSRMNIRLKLGNESKDSEFV